MELTLLNGSSDGLNQPARVPCLLNQTLRIMKLTAIFFLAVCMHVSARSVSQTVTLSGRDLPLEKVFTEIERQTGFLIVCNFNLLQKARPVTIEAKQLPLEQALKSVLEGQALSYKFNDRNIVISRTMPHPFNSAPDTLNYFFPVTGIVHGPKGEPLAGVNIAIKGSFKGTVTDVGGGFSINAQTGDKLVISFIGYVTREIMVNPGASVGIIVLNISEVKMDEMQVIAYGTQSKKFSTNNVYSVKSEDIEKQPVTNPLLALYGRVPGLFIQQASGALNGGVNVTIQGLNSLSNGNEPFYVIDGVPFTQVTLPKSTMGAAILGIQSPLNFINPTDIESIEVLQDADATAIYGSRAANGAILITTKKGKTGDVKVDMNIQKGWGQVSRRVDLMNTQQYLDLRREALKNSNRAVGAADYDLNGAWDLNADTDWQEELIGGTAGYTNINTSVSGGTSNTQFLVGATYNKQTTVYPTDLGTTKATIHFNINSSTQNQRFKFNLSGSYQKDLTTLGTIDLASVAVKLAPNAPALYNADGSLNWQPDPKVPGANTFDNPMASLLRKYTGKTNNLLSNSLISYRIIPGLDIKANLGYSLMSSEDNNIVPITSYRPEYRPLVSREANYDFGNISTWIAEPQLEYHKAIGASKIEALTGVTFQQTKTSYRYLNAEGFSTDAQLENILAAPNVRVLGALESEYNYSAAFGRFNYRLKDKYVLSLNIRRDGSSRFGSENLFNNFYSVAGAWLFGDEHYFKSGLPFISTGKLRASYGTSGNDQIGDYGFLSLYNNYSVGVPYQGASGLYTTEHSNPFLQWEETRKLNVGMNVGILQDKIVLDVNFFRNRSSNQLLYYSLLTSTGFPTVRANLPATVQNTGWEFLFDADLIKSKKIDWQASFNLTVPKNKLVQFDDLETSPYASDLMLGESMTTRKAFHFAGVNDQTGRYQFLDSKNNLTSAPVTPADRISLLKVDPKFYGGFSSELSYGNFSFSVLFQFVKKVGRDFRFATAGAGSFNVNEPVTFLNRWKSSGHMAEIQRVSLIGSEYLTPYRAGTNSDGAYGDASYLRFKNASISYRLPAVWIKKAGLANARIFAQGQNLLNFTNYLGSDPETQVSVALPTLRMYIIGFQLTF